MLLQSQSHRVFRVLSFHIFKTYGKILCGTQYFSPTKTEMGEKNQHYSATENNLLYDVKKMLALLRFAIEHRGWRDLLHIIPHSKIWYWAKNLIYSQEESTNYMTKSWKSKDSTIYTPPAALNIHYIHATSPLFSWDSLNIYNHVINQKEGNSWHFKLEFYISVCCISTE